LDHPPVVLDHRGLLLSAGLFVAPARRGGGIGRKLIETVYDKARGLGCSRVYWLTHETNADAMRLYDVIADRPGFVQYRKIF
jgi:GNAT superfamily N-acetyltransferase